MQIQFAVLLALVALATLAAASIEASGASSIHVRSATSARHHGRAVADGTHFNIRGTNGAEQRTRVSIQRLQQDIKLLEVLKTHKDVTPEMQTPIFKDLQVHAVSASKSLQQLLAAQDGKRDTIVPTVDGLVSDLQKVFGRLTKLLTELLHNTSGSNKMYDQLILPLLKTVGGVLNGLEATLVKIAPPLGVVLDPVVNELSKTLGALGIHLRSLNEDDEMATLELVERKDKKAQSAQKPYEDEIRHHLDQVTHDLARLEKLKQQGKGKVDPAAAKQLVRETFRHAAAASKSIKRVARQVRKQGGKKGARGRKAGVGGGDKRANQADEGDGLFGTLLYRLVHDLVCLLHAVIKLAVDLLGNLGLGTIKNFVSGVDGEILEPSLDEIKGASKQLGAGLSPELDPLLGGVQKLLAGIGLA